MMIEYNALLKAVTFAISYVKSCFYFFFHYGDRDFYFMRTKITFSFPD